MSPLEIILKQTRNYLAVPSVVGYEQLFLKKLREDFEALNLKVTPYEGLLCIEGDAPLSATLSAHIDRHGLIANGIGELEYAAYRVKENKYDTSSEIKKSMWLKIRDRFNGEMVYAYDPVTGEKKSRGIISSGYFCPVRENYVFNVENLKSLSENTPVSFSDLCPVEDHQISGQLDNVISVGIGYALYKNGFKGTLLLTTEEEIGRSWEHILNYYQTTKQSTQKLLVLDTSPFSKDDKIDDSSVVLRNKDNNGSFNPAFTELVKHKCQDLGIPYIVKDEFVTQKSTSKGRINLGNTELGRLITESKGNINGTTIQLPTIGYHSNKEEASFPAISNIFNLLNHL